MSTSFVVSTTATTNHNSHHNAHHNHITASALSASAQPWGSIAGPPILSVADITGSGAGSHHERKPSSPSDGGNNPNPFGSGLLFGGGAGHAPSLSTSSNPFVALSVFGSNGVHAGPVNALGGLPRTSSLDSLATLSNNKSPSAGKVSTPVFGLPPAAGGGGFPQAFGGGSAPPTLSATPNSPSSHTIDVGGGGGGGFAGGGSGFSSANVSRVHSFRGGAVGGNGGGAKSAQHQQHIQNGVFPGKLHLQPAYQAAAAAAAMQNQQQQQLGYMFSSSVPAMPAPTSIITSASSAMSGSPVDASQRGMQQHVPSSPLSAALAQHLRNIDEFEEQQSGVPLVPYVDLAQQAVEDLGRCNIIDVGTEPLFAGARQAYYSEGQHADIVTGTAVMQNGQRVKVQRVMAGQIWLDFIKSFGLEKHAIGKLLAFVANAPVTVFGMLPLQALKHNPHRAAVPAMCGFWLSIDGGSDAGGELLDLQRATVIFARRGLLCAFDAEERRRLLELAESRRAQGSTGLPESPMTFEAAKTAPKRATEREVEVYRYLPPPRHPFPVHRGGFRPFLSRGKASMDDIAASWPMQQQQQQQPPTPPSALSAPQAQHAQAPLQQLQQFTLLGVDNKQLEPWMRKVVHRMRPLSSDEPEIVVHKAGDPAWC